MVCLDGEGEKNGSGVGKFAGGLGGEIFASAATGEGFANGSVAREIIAQRTGYDVALRNGMSLWVVRG